MGLFLFSIYFSRNGTGAMEPEHSASGPLGRRLAGELQKKKDGNAARSFTQTWLWKMRSRLHEKPVLSGREMGFVEECGRTAYRPRNPPPIRLPMGDPRSAVAGLRKGGGPRELYIRTPFLPGRISNSSEEGWRDGWRKQEGRKLKSRNDSMPAASCSSFGFSLFPAAGLPWRTCRLVIPPSHPSR
ncbi:hypothetical protein LX36DRAFT_279762 [Colletotrichum falcatum]|nr:hypothetical protein LX36DRAFT_279762 [Colletotrichum falcatum]